MECKWKVQAEKLEEECLPSVFHGTVKGLFKGIFFRTSGLGFLLCKKLQALSCFEDSVNLVMQVGDSWEMGRREEKGKRKQKKGERESEDIAFSLKDPYCLRPNQPTKAELRSFCSFKNHLLF